MPKSLENLQKVRLAIERFRKDDRKSSGMIFTDNWYDSHPRLLILDPVLNPYDKTVWLVIRARCSPDMSLTAFPTYEEIQSALNISKGTVATSITKLRLTRWITLLHREQVRDKSGQFQKDGNIYMVHGEPLSLKDTFEIDTNYMGFIHNSTQHRNSDIRRVATAIIQSIGHVLDGKKEVLANEHPFDRRMEAWQALDGDSSAMFFSYHPRVLQNSQESQNSEKSKTKSANESTVVHQMNHGKKKRYSKLVSTVGSSNNFKKKYNKPTDIQTNAELVFPDSLTDNQKHLVTLQLNKLPDDLPQPPAPWKCWEQLLLDELSGRISIGKKGQCEPVRNVALLISAYCKRLVENGIGLKEDNRFQIDLAEKVFQSRVRRQKSKRSYELARQRCLERTDALIKKHNSD